MSYSFDHLNVLVIEDNKPVLDLAYSILLAFGVGEVITARDGKTGFELFCQKNPDIVICDWMMEPVDGIGLTRLIREDAASPNRFVPVILMTGVSERGKVMQARDAGVTEFLLKPFNAREMYRRIEQVIERPRQFVRTEEFFGPDRRRLRGVAYPGDKRRFTDVPEEPFRRDINFNTDLKVRPADDKTRR